MAASRGARDDWDPGRSDGRARVGTRAVPAERSETLGSPRAGEGVGGGAGPGDAGLGEDGGPRPGRVELLPGGVEDQRPVIVDTPASLVEDADT